MDTDLNDTLKQSDILKARLQAIRPLNVEALQKIKAAFEIEYTYESNKIEGNTLTLQETALVVNEGVTIGGNGRTSRLLMNLHLLSKGYVITSLKANNEAKQACYTALEQSHTSGDREAFNRIVANAVKNALENCLRILEG
ncbi:MAG: hypothetical protein LBU37_04040 [Tannerellaceae bacterium]|jgi:Fic family protein|nr:hypothetical protein [Tannerellaceae bacterium]